MWTNENLQQLLSGTTGTLISLAGYQMSLDEIDQIVSIVCSILGIIVTFIGVVVIPLIKKIRSAKSDGKVTIDEFEDIINDTKDNITKFNDKEDK